MIREKLQKRRIYLNTFNARFLCLKRSGTYLRVYGSLRTASVLIYSILRWSGYILGFLVHLQQLFYTSFGFKQSRTAYSPHGSSSVAFSHIHCVLRWSGTCLSAYGSLCTASLHISSILRWSGTYSRAFGSSSTAFSHILLVLKHPTDVVFCQQLFHTFLVS